MRARLCALSLTGIIASMGATSHAATDIQFWHSMEGALGERVNTLVSEFNQTQSDYVVTAIYKGTYGESMNAGIAAFRAGNAPDILQVFEVGTATMMYAKGAIQPIQEMSEKAGDPINPADFLGAVASYYSSADGKLVSMPFNSSTPVLYYNKDAFKKAGMDPEVPPKTWNEVAAAGKKLREAGLECGYTTSWPAWIQLETFGAWHNIPYASLDNGFGGLDARLEINKPDFIKHLTFLASMSKDGTFTYGGRGDAPNGLFTGGKCGMFTGSSGNRANIIKTGQFEFGTSSLPYHDDIQGAPQNTIIGGASLWVFAKKSPEVYLGITKFFKFLSSPEKSAQWHQETGYVPVTKAGYMLTQESGFYAQNTGADIAVKQLDATTTENSRGIRLGYLPQIRDIEDAEMEMIFSGKTSPEAGLENMVKRGNELLSRFQKSVQ
ncbi:sn-glycerol-3-phosphate ABC transporter substrate-binding protein UgpB [Alcaligenaceae bacterium]|nr:sn-glycerol-3-phosphate ABC transporter substrate-binding protein UgpB [Alcaligenaceae bacterium]